MELEIKENNDNPLLHRKEIKLVINHAGCPPENINCRAWKNWQQSLQSLSHLENISIKCSGFEMINRDYSPTWQQLVINQCLKTFGLDRTMLASNFPLCLFTGSYQKSWLAHNKNSESHAELR